ncbi:FAS1 domain-containing protein [Testicularia cyperi]|uniref:FAS1 domain-containing protein n=1 Tax=Testicularia cyperi TaxID=1882483 RepID=A0A317XHN7_9BASI|nr:FAS1 domain-containing protein [Testicularia cyperi]
MKFLSAVLLGLTATAGTLAQSSGNATAFAEGLLSALRQNNLTALADAVGNNSQALLAALQGGNKTVLAPTNQAFQALGGDVDTDTLVATIAYHGMYNSFFSFLNGSYTDSAITTDGKTIAPTALTMSDYVMLGGRNRSQVAVLSKQASNNTNYVQLASGIVSFALTMDGPQYQNIRVQPITQVLTIPGTTSEVAGQLGASQLATLLQSANLVDALDNSVVTVFAPANAAIEAAMSTIEMATPEQQMAVLLNHVVNGTVVYSTALGDTPRATSASGNELMFMSNSSGAYVQSGNITAKILMTDYVAKNGVIHIIDNVLVNTTSNPQAAGSAYSSATAAAATQTSAAGTGPSATASGSGSGGSNAAASLNIPGSGIAAAAAALIGSGFWLLA